MLPFARPNSLSSLTVARSMTYITHYVCVTAAKAIHYTTSLRPKRSLAPDAAAALRHSDATFFSHFWRFSSYSTRNCSPNSSHKSQMPHFSSHLLSVTNSLRHCDNATLFHHSNYMMPNEPITPSHECYTTWSLWCHTTLPHGRHDVTRSHDHGISSESFSPQQPQFSTTNGDATSNLHWSNASYVSGTDNWVNYHLVQVSSLLFFPLTDKKYVFISPLRSIKCDAFSTA